MEEVDKGSKPIEAVGTAVAAFVGFTEKAVDVKNGETISLVGKPSLITNWGQYVQKFGGFIAGAFLPDSVYGYFANGGGICYVVSIKTLGASADPNLATASSVSVVGSDKKNLLQFTARDGGPSGNNVQVEIKSTTPAGEEPKDGGSFNVVISVAGQIKETFNDLTTGKGERNVQTVVDTQSKVVTVKQVGKDAIVPAAGTYPLTGGEIKTQAITLKDYQGNSASRTGLGGLEPLDDVTMICVPDLMSSFLAGEIDNKGIQAVQQSIIDFCEQQRYCFAILDCPPGLSPQEVKEWRLTVNYDSTRAALYYPWIETADMTGNNGRTRFVPPSGHMAGVYARVDNTRGVHKAPGNEIVRTVLGLEVNATKGEHDTLNPIGVNVIRSFPGRGIRIWGARTLSSDPSWKYINVRRVFNMVEESIERGTQWVVFEPNDANLWARIRRDITAFLKLVWRSGALFGNTPEEAFYVKCDLETNPPEVRDVGQLRVEIGICPTKPAEFVIIQISQWAGPAAQ